MKYEFASAQWLAALHGMLAYRAATDFAKSPDFRISVCEVYLNVPADRGGEAGQIAWSCVSNGPNIDFALRERDDVDLKIKVDYTFVTEVAGLDTDDPAQAARLATLVEEGRRTGKAERIGADAAPSGSSPIHNLLARMTA